MKVNEIMTQNPEFVYSGDSVKRAAEVMRQVNAGAVPIFDGDTAIGILTDRDIAVRLVAEGKDPLNVKAGEIMSKDPVFCSSDADIEEAVRLMEDKQLRRLLVKDAQGKVAGIVSIGDLAVSLDKEKSGEVIKEVSQPSEPER
ncbi:MAG: CBS domain-containing protein [Desulfobacterales bacterium]